MSSAENDKPTGRLVWISDTEREQMRGLSGWGEETLSDVLHRWDAAPANPAETIAASIKASYQYQHTGSNSSPKPKFPDDYEAFCYPDRAAEAVLRALGKP